MNKLISIIIPNFNKGNFISETLDCLLSQTYKYWEAIIVDDGSTDNSINVIESYCLKDARIKFKSRLKLPKGASHCRNIGLSDAKGDFIIFLDSDDLLKPTCFEYRINEITIDENLDFMVFPMGTFYSKIGDSKMIWKAQKTNHLNKFLAHNLPWAVPCPIWKRDSLIKFGGFDVNYQRLEDVEFHTRILMNKELKYALSKSKSPDCYYRISENRKVASPEEFYTNWIDSLARYIQLMKTLLEEKGLSTKIPLLKGTLIKSLNSILHAKEIGQIDVSLYMDLLAKCIVLADELGKDTWILKWYIKLYDYNFYKIKGFNFLFYKIYIHI